LLSDSAPTVSKYREGGKPLPLKLKTHTLKALLVSDSSNFNEINYLVPDYAYMTWKQFAKIIDCGICSQLPFIKVIKRRED
jgi:hypothetical protein